MVELEERWTINPLFSFGSGGRSEWLRVGLSDINVLGRYLELAGVYERFEQYDGGMVYARAPRFLGRRLDLLVLADHLVRPRREYSDRRLRGRVELAGLVWADRLRLGAGFEAFADEFLAPPHGEPDLPRDSRAWRLDGTARVGRVDTVRLRQTGASLEVRPGVGRSSDGGTWLQASLEGLGYGAPGSRVNLAVRVQAGAMTAAPRHLRYHLGGLSQVRGYRDNLVRTSRFALLNAEARLVAWDSTWLALMPTLFADGAVADEEGGEVVGLGSFGFGLRLLAPRFVRAGLRVDFALPVSTPICKAGGCSPFSLGVYQFF